MCVCMRPLHWACYYALRSTHCDTPTEKHTWYLSQHHRFQNFNLVSKYSELMLKMSIFHGFLWETETKKHQKINLYKLYNTISTTTTTAVKIVKYQFTLLVVKKLVMSQFTHFWCKIFELEMVPVSKNDKYQVWTEAGWAGGIVGVVSPR